MPKRKVISDSGKSATTKKLKSEQTSEKNTQSQLSFDSPRQCLQSLVYPKTLDEFFKNYWEKDPVFVQRKNPTYYGNICTKAELLAIVKKEELMYESDLFVTKYTKDDDGEEIAAEGKATMANLKKYFEEKKAAVMLSRPHRFNKEVESMLQLLELYFGSCAYAHLEVTPSGCQGHAPCYVGREVFNLQLEGKKCWRLYKPIIKLSTQDSEDLDESEIGEVLHEYTLEPGDLLYLPRGAVFQAASLDEQHSTDISIELYDENSWGKFISTIIKRAISRASENDVTFREGLPINYLSYMGFGKNEKNSELVGTNDEVVQTDFRKLVPKLDKSDLEKQKKFEEKLKTVFASLAKYLDPHWGADYLGTWFMGNRLAPTLIEKPEDNNVPDDKSLVQMKHPEHVRIVFSKSGDQFMKDDDDEEDGDEEEDEVMVEDEEEKASKEDEKASKEEEKASKEEEKKGKKDKAKNIKASPKKGKENSSKEKQEAEKKSKSAKSAKKEAEEEENGEADDEADDEDEEMEEGSEDLDNSGVDDKPCILLQHSLQNDSNNDDIEMVPAVLQYPVHYSDALLILHRSTKPVAVKDLPLSVEERIELANTLWAEGLLVVKESS